MRATSCARRSGPLGALVRMLALLALLPTLPGITEAMEDAAHWVREGHTVHNEDPADGHETGPEHGCSGLQHLCRCCPAGHALPIAVSTPNAALTGRPVRTAWQVAAGLGADEQTPPRRPPRA